MMKLFQLLTYLIALSSGGASHAQSVGGKNDLLKQEKPSIIQKKEVKEASDISGGMKKSTVVQNNKKQNKDVAIDGGGVTTTRRFLTISRRGQFRSGTYTLEVTPKNEAEYLTFTEEISALLENVDPSEYPDKQLSQCDTHDGREGPCTKVTGCEWGEKRKCIGEPVLLKSISSAVTKYFESILRYTESHFGMESVEFDRHRRFSGTIGSIYKNGDLKLEIKVETNGNLPDRLKSIIIVVGFSFYEPDDTKFLGDDVIAFIKKRLEEGDEKVNYLIKSE